MYYDTKYLWQYTHIARMIETSQQFTRDGNRILICSTNFLLCRCDGQKEEKIRPILHPRPRLESCRKDWISILPFPLFLVHYLWSIEWNLLAIYWNIYTREEISAASSLSKVSHLSVHLSVFIVTTNNGEANSRLFSSQWKGHSEFHRHQHPSSRR